MLERARVRCPTVAEAGHLFQMDVTDLKFPNGALDAAVATFLFWVLPNDLSVLRSAERPPCRRFVSFVGS
jgi:hypothetical protein